MPSRRENAAATALPAYDLWVDRVLAALAGAEARDRMILNRRTFALQPASLQELGTELGITRERVRQLEARALGRLAGLEPESLDASLQRLRAGRRTPLLLPELAAHEPWLAGVERHPGMLMGVLRELGAEHRLEAADETFVVVPSRIGSLKELVARCRQLVVDRRADCPEPALRLQSVADHLAGCECIDLLPLVEQRLRELGPGVLLPTHVERVHALLRAAGRSMAFAELLAAMQPMRAGKLTEVLGRAGLVRRSHGVYELPVAPAAADELLPRLRADVVAFLECEPEQQWRAADLLDALVQAGADWAVDLEPGRFAHLLQQVPELVDLKRSTFGLASVHAGRALLADMAAEELVQAGGPLLRSDLLQRVRRRRGVGAGWRPRYPVVFLGGGWIGLAERDLGLRNDAWQSWLAAVHAALQAGARLDPAELVRLLRAAGGPAVPEEAVLTLLSGAQSLHRRVRTAMGE